VIPHRFAVNLTAALFLTLPATIGDNIAPFARPVAADCDCSHLAALQAELRNAQTLQRAFRDKSADLRKLGASASQAELQRWAAKDARAGLVNVPGNTGPSEVDFGPYGLTLSVDNWDKYNAQELCRMSDASTRELGRAKTGAACTAIGAALQAHEDVHSNTCRKIGFRGYMAMHGADRAQEEAEAYGAQIAVLRGAIAAVLERTNLHIEFEEHTTVTMPANPLYNSITLDKKGLLQTTRASINGDVIHFDGRGEHTTNGKVDGNCKFTAGFPHTAPAGGSIDTDGLTANVRYAVEGSGPSMMMECRVPGGGRGTAMSLPAPVNGGGGIPGAVPIPLRDGAETEMNMANTQAAQAMAGSGISISGKAKMRLVLDCPKKQ
jgi:hypothetical protein